jgi:multidrug efflux pump subunit AcrA (membrane-fusion protein)
VFGAAVLAFLVFGSWDYRVQAPFVLQTENVAYLPAPFDGYIGSVEADVGDEVSRTESLLALDTQELLLEQSEAAADRERYTREVEKARAEDALADMRIAAALAEQARVRLERVRYRLAQATVTAPFDGVVIEGDLKERIGSPVRQGEVLFKIARLTGLYVEAEVAERDIDEIALESCGEIAFVSQPDLAFPVAVVRVEPAAQPKSGKNVFVVRLALVESPAGWLRPGMTGVCKINVGKRRLLWIFTHRTVDFLRLALWW